MAGNKIGGKKASLTNKQKYGEDFYKRVGKIGGKAKGFPKGFARDPAKASLAGTVGGLRSRKNHAPLDDMDVDKIDEARRNLEAYLSNK